MSTCRYPCGIDVLSYFELGGVNVGKKSSISQKWATWEVGASPLKSRLHIDIFWNFIQHVYAIEDVMVVVAVAAPFPTILER